MLKLTTWIVGLAMTALMLAGHGAAQQRPPRLLVQNNTRTVVTVFALMPRSPRVFRGRVNASASFSFYPVKNGDRFQAEWQGRTVAHTVQLRPDRSYGGLQDRWVVP